MFIHSPQHAKMNKQNEQRGKIQIHSTFAKRLLGQNAESLSEIKGQTGTRIDIGNGDKNGHVVLTVKGNTERSVQATITMIRQLEKKFEDGEGPFKKRTASYEQFRKAYTPTAQSSASEQSTSTSGGILMNEQNNLNWNSDDGEELLLAAHVGNIKLTEAQTINPPKNAKVSVDSVGCGLFRSTVSIPVQSVPHFFGKDGWRIKSLMNDTSTWISKVNEDPDQDERTSVIDTSGMVQFVVSANDERNIQRAVYKINGFKEEFLSGKLKGLSGRASRSRTNSKS